MGTEAGVEDGIVFQDDDGGLDGIESGATFREHGPTGAQGILTANIARDDSVIWNIPGAAVNNERGLHGKKISDIRDQSSGNKRSLPISAGRLPPASGIQFLKERKPWETRKL